MSDRLAWIIVVAFGFASAAIFAFLLHGCGPSLRAATYGAELNACVADASTREAADDCTDAVAKRYGRDGRAAR